MKIAQFRCTVCGYIHDHSEPPELCPVCGVGVEKFVAVDAPQVSLLQEMLQTFQPHAVAAHFPNALLPTLVLFIAIAVVFTEKSFESAAFYMLCMVLVMAPVTVMTGLYDWKRKFAGQRATIFKKKLLLGCLLVVLALVAVALRLMQPEAVATAGTLQSLYYGLLLAMLLCVTMLGHYGGKLVFSLMGKES